MSEYNITYEVVQDHDGYFRVKNITKKRPYRFSTSTGDHFGKTTDLTKLLNAVKEEANYSDYFDDKQIIIVNYPAAKDDWASCFIEN